MTIDVNALRIDGIYAQDDAGNLMLRVKLPAGVISAEQAKKVAHLAAVHAGGRLHLTTRGSIELHDLQIADIEPVRRGLAAVGLTSRGACGGAVRGVSCSTSFGPGFPRAQRIARWLHRHFTGNPYFEGLPKKFKVAVEAGYEGSRHLIQDVGLVLTGPDRSDGIDLWCAGGLGVQPTAGFCFAKGLREEEIIPLLESIIRVYAMHTTPPKRLKHLLMRIGEEEFRTLVARERKGRLPFIAAIELEPAPIPETDHGIELHIPFGEMTSDELTQIADVAQGAAGFLVVSSDQNLILAVEGEGDSLRRDLEGAGFLFAEDEVRIRVCPGSHECKKGLAPTRDLAADLLATLPQGLNGETFAFSGCPNSCAQPQLAAYGISTTRVTKNGEERIPLFTLYRRTGEGLGETVARDVDWQALKAVIAG